MVAPLVPLDVVIPRLPYVPLYAERLWSSDFWAVATDAEFRAGFALWVKSWSQQPPGSLPTDDHVLCRLAELGRNIRKWHVVKRVALRHWVECDDGRLYHPVIAEFIISAQNRLTSEKNRTLAARKNRWKSTKRPSVTDSVTEGNRIEEKSQAFTKPDLSPLTPLPNGKGGPRPPSSSLDERGRIAPTEEHQLYETINAMRYDRADAYRRGDLAAWDRENQGKLQDACERLGELRDQHREQPEEPLRPLGDLIDRMTKGVTLNGG